jgi:hypothetical protein
MAKKNNNNNFFTQMRSQYGENFLNYLDPKTLQSRSIQIFRQMSRGQIDIEENGRYFLDPKLMEASLIAIDGKVILHSISADGVRLLQDHLRQNNGIVGQDIISVGEHHARAAQGYSMIQAALNYINQSKDLSVLIGLVANLSGYRNYI